MVNSAMPRLCAYLLRLLGPWRQDAHGFAARRRDLEDVIPLEVEVHQYHRVTRAEANQICLAARKML